jgi:hypothetical protein
LVTFVSLLLGAAGAFAADNPTAFMSKDEFGDFMQGYYRNPSPERVEPAMRFVAGTDLMTADNTDRMLQTSFSCLFQRHPEKREEWKKAIATLAEPARTYFHVAMESDPTNMFLATPTVPKKNDMAWGCFFITGDVSYVQDVIVAMKYLDERKDLSRFLTAGSAQWSLAGLSRENDLVRAALETAAKGSDKKLAAAANDALTKSVTELRASMIETLRAQKQAGVW